MNNDYGGNEIRVSPVLLATVEIALLKIAGFGIPVFMIAVPYAVMGIIDFVKWKI